MKRHHFKFSLQQFEALYTVIRSEMMKQMNSTDFNNRLYMCLIAAIGKRIHGKMYFNPRESYGFSFTLAESLAFFSYFNPIQQQIHGELERVVVGQLCNTIHQQLI